MTMFAYKGRTNSGNPVNGQIEAVSTDSAAGQLLERGITPINIAEAKIKGNQNLEQYFEKFNQRRPSLDDMILLNRQLFTLVKAGIPLNRAVSGLLETTRNNMLITALGDIIRALDAGYELSTSMAQHPKGFPHLMVSMVKVGETTGQLENAFLRVSRSIYCIFV